MVLFRVFVLAFLPISEVRGAIPYGILGAHLPVSLVLSLALLGNILPYFLVMYFLEVLTGVLCRMEWFDRLFQNYTKSVKKRFEKYSRWEKWGIFFFVAVPLPFTGVWTGSLICFLRRFSVKESFPFIFGGLLAAMAIVIAVTILGYAITL
ncbi:MAG: COG2426 family protein [Candidatus Caldatribacteriaceae bacterium]